MAYIIDKRLNDLIVRDLPLNRRQQLCSYLNVEQVLMSDCGLARDYRGIAQQLNLSYTEIAQLEKLIDPCGTLLNNEQLSRLTVYDFCEFLINIGRYDILDDMIPLILEELTLLKNNQNQLTRIPALIENETTIWYDAYVCYADSDLNFVKNLAEYLESPSIGFRLFIRDRDLLIGNWVYETFARLIETQCRRMLIILSPDFLQSHDCKFQSLFAAGLAIEKCSRILVPIIYRPCNELPSMLRLMSKIDMSTSSSTNSIPEWSLKRLVMSIQEQPNPDFLKKSTKFPPKPITNNNNDDDENRNQSSPIQMMIQFDDNNHSNNKSNELIKPTYQEMILMDSNSNNSSHPHQQTNITVISNSSNEDDSTQLLSKYNNKNISHSSENTQIQSNTNKESKNRTKSWIKTFKKKIKAAR